jgi:hypothetical protein
LCSSVVGVDLVNEDEAVATGTACARRSARSTATTAAAASSATTVTTRTAICTANGTTTATSASAEPNRVCRQTGQQLQRYVVNSIGPV